MDADRFILHDSNKRNEAARPLLQSGHLASENAGAILLCTRALASKELRAGYSLCEKRNVVAGGYQACTSFPAVDHEEAPLEAGEVDCRRQTGWPASDHEAVKQFSVVCPVAQAARGAILRWRPNCAASATSSIADITSSGAVWWTMWPAPLTRCSVLPGTSRCRRAD